MSTIRCPECDHRLTPEMKWVGIGARQMIIFLVLTKNGVFHSAWSTAEEASQCRNSLEFLLRQPYTVFAYSLEDRSLNGYYD